MRILIVDDEKNIRATLKTCLEGLGHEVAEAPSADAALHAARRQPCDVAFLDLRLGETSGLELLAPLLADNPSCDVVMITAHATFDTAVEAIRRGAKDYLPKPFTPAQIEHVVHRLGEQKLLQRKVLDLESRLQEVSPDIDLETQSPRMKAVLENARRAAGAGETTLLLRGENGTGKGILARMLHAGSPRVGRPFVVVNCPTLSEELLTSELFGHVQGAFTGAIRDRAGMVESADGGTLFLDEIGELPVGLQTKLLRFLQEKTYERVGDSKTRKADVRVIAATNRDLAAAVKDGRFREDLLFRLNVIEITLPPLRERAEDILPLARRFLGTFARSAGRPSMELSKASEELLLRYSWPGNIRELRNAIERAVILWPAPVIEPSAFPERIAPAALAGPRLGGDATVDEIEREHIERVLERTANLDEAAKILGIDASTLWRKRKKYER